LSFLPFGNFFDRSETFFGNGCLHGVLLLIVNMYYFLTIKHKNMKNLLFLFGVLLQVFIAQAQFTCLGSAVSMTGGEYDLTAGVTTSMGAMWSNGGDPTIPQYMDFTHDFVIYFRAKLAPTSGGLRREFGDGFCAVFGSNITPTTPPNEPDGSLGYYGYLFGIGTCSYVDNPSYDKSIAVEFDVFDDNPPYVCTGDIASDHAQISQNADFAAIAGPSALSSASANIKDGYFHQYRIMWRSSTHTLCVAFDGVVCVSGVIDPSTAFIDPTKVQWGFTGSTGAAVLDQYIEGVTFSNSLCEAADPTSVYITGPTILCAGDVATYSGYSSLPESFPFTCTPPELGTITDAGVLTTTAAPAGGGGGIIDVAYMAGNCCPVTTAHLLVTVNPMPYSPLITYVGCPLPCPSTPLLYTLTGGTPGATVGYSWASSCCVGSGIVTLDISGNASVSIPAAGVVGAFNFTVNNTVYNGCTNLISSTSTIDLEWPNASFTSGYLPQVVCAGTCVRLAITGTPNTTAEITYSGGTASILIGPDGFGILDPCITLYSTTTFTIGMVTSSCCSSYSGATTTITVLPTPTITLAATPNPVCEGSPVTFTATCTPSSAPYVWTGPAAASDISSVTGTSYSISWATPAYAGVYTIATDPNIPCPVSASTTLAVISAPVASVTGSTALCGPGGGATVTINSAIGNTVYYTVNGLSQPPVTTFPDIITTSYSSTEDYSIVSVVDPLGCHSISGFPDAIVTVVEGNTCVTVESAEGPINYVFTGPPYATVTFYINSNPSDICTVTLDGSGLYYLSTYVTFGAPATTTGPGYLSDPTLSCTCLSSTPTLIGFVTLTSVSVPNPDGGDPCIFTPSCSGSSRTSSSGSGFGVSASIDTIKANPISSIGQISSFGDEISLEPNPNSGSFVLSYTSPTIKDQDITVEITDMLGQQIFKKTTHCLEEVFKENIVLNSNVEDGMYYISLQCGNENKKIKCIVNKK
jgi:Bacterial lectin/Secretion system C-terminal sorting domain